MALPKREICRVGDSPTASSSPDLPKPQSPKPSKQAAWKSSKFFSRSMAAGEMLKGLKKLSTASDEKDADNKDGEKETFKSRFSSLRRKSGSDTDKMADVDAESLKTAVEVRGVVCKKEDLMFLSPKKRREGRRVSSPAELIVPGLPTAPPPPPLKSPSIKVAPDSPLARRTARSMSLDPTALLPDLDRHRLLVPPAFAAPRPTHKRHAAAAKAASDDLCIRKTGAFLEVMPEMRRRLSGPLIQVRIPEEEEGASEEDEPVQWDDGGNFVDPNVLGGAIEAFLKGMGAPEKRVSFKKSLIK